MIHYSLPPSLSRSPNNQTRLDSVIPCKTSRQSNASCNKCINSNVIRFSCPILFHFRTYRGLLCVLFQMSSYSPMHILSTLILSSLFYFCIDFVAAICYYPDRSIAHDVPCSDSEDESNCCGPGYACLSNKVCRQAHQDSDGKVLKYTYGRGSCTDIEWRSSACPSICILGSSRKSSLFKRQ